jgi:pimeloyl-ACP methyl ester carboxylesterase
MMPFTVDWSEAAVDRVLHRVRDCRLPAALPGAGWSLGCDAGFLRALRRHWLEAYDWRAAVANLNRHPQFLADIDGLTIHFVHVRGEGAGRRRPLILTHGWPGSHFEFWEVIEPLAFPSKHGGKAEDAFDLVIPSLPGFAFSGKPAGLFGQRRTAGLWHRLVTEVLGYDRYLAQGGDWGGVVTSWLGLDQPQAVAGIHLNMLPFRTNAGPQNDEELQWLRRQAAAQQALGGYSALQTSKAQSLAWAAADNPLGQAAWIVERFHDWADLEGRCFEDVFSLDQLLTNIMLYVMTDSFASAAWYYPAFVQEGRGVLPKGTRCETPTAFAAFRDPLLPSPPRSRAELAYNIVRWSVPPSGGHFAAAESPAWFVEDLRAWGAQAAGGLEPGST